MYLFSYVIYKVILIILPNQRSNPGLLHHRWILPAKLSGTPKNTEVVSLSLLQRIFLIQESNQGLLHCRWIIYQLSYQGSPQHPYIYFKNRQHYLDNQGRECFAQNFNLSFLFSHSYSSTASIKLVVPSRIFTS